MQQYKSAPQSETEANRDAQGRGELKLQKSIKIDVLDIWKA